ncbi:MAG: hypothetical protein N2444_04240 [Methylocystis sp.]|nr:hypothetical protein [Methylocystis sp.]
MIDLKRSLAFMAQLRRQSALWPSNAAEKQRRASKVDLCKEFVSTRLTAADRANINLFIDGGAAPHAAFGVASSCSTRKQPPG